jgi:hypothetical protein
MEVVETRETSKGRLLVRRMDLETARACTALHACAIAEDSITRALPLVFRVWWLDLRLALLARRERRLGA